MLTLYKNVIDKQICNMDGITWRIVVTFQYISVCKKLFVGRNRIIYALRKMYYKGYGLSQVTTSVKF